MRLRHTAAASIVCAGSVATAALAQGQTGTDDQDQIVHGIHMVCTGTTNDVRTDPRWRDYALKLEFVGEHGQYLGDEQVTVSGNNLDVSVHCGGPWVLMKLPAGAYHLSADVADAGHKDMTAKVGDKGQATVIFRFPNAGGETTQAIGAGSQAAR